MARFVTLGMFIMDEFEFMDEDGVQIRDSVSQIGGGGTFACIGARIWLDDDEVGMIVDRGQDWSADIQRSLETYGSPIWLFRDHSGPTTRARNSYRGESRAFEYLTPRIRPTPNDLKGTRLSRPSLVHFICSPSRASAIISEMKSVPDWKPTTIYEPIPDRCVPDELPALVRVLADISILSPNADEALSLLSITDLPSKPTIESAAHLLLGYGPPTLYVIIRSGALGAFVLGPRVPGHGKWVDAFWTEQDKDKVVDVTGAGNSFLGGVAAGLHLSNGDVYQAAIYGAISASFIVQQPGLPSFDGTRWNGDDPQRRLQELRSR